MRLTPLFLITYNFFLRYSLNQLLKSEQKANKIPQIRLYATKSLNIRHFSTYCGADFFNNCEKPLSIGLTHSQNKVR
jgi:hypothetical protein